MTLCCKSGRLLQLRPTLVASTRIVAPLFLLLLLNVYLGDVTETVAQVYTNHFLVHTNLPGIENAHRVAKRHGFINRGAVRILFKIKF